MLKLCLRNGLRHAATASEISPCFQVLWAEKFENLEYECLEIGGFEGIFSLK